MPPLPEYRRTAIAENIGVVRSSDTVGAGFGAAARIFGELAAQGAAEAEKKRVADAEAEGFNAVIRDEEGALQVELVDNSTAAARARNRAATTRYLSELEIEHRRVAADNAALMRDDPARFEAFWRGQSDGSLQQVPEPLRGRAETLLAEIGRQTYTGLLTQKQSSDLRLAHQAWDEALGYKAADVAALAAAGQHGGEAYAKAAAAYEEQLRAGVESRFITEDQAQLRRRALADEGEMLGVAHHAVQAAVAAGGGEVGRRALAKELERLRDPEFKVDEKRRHQIEGQAWQDFNRREALRAGDQHRFNELLKDHLVALREGKPEGAGVSEAEIRARMAPDQAADVMRQIGEERAVGQARKAIAMASPAEEAAIVTRFLPDGENYREEASRRDFLLRIVDEKRRAIAADPVAYVRQAAPDVASAWASAIGPDGKINPDRLMEAIGRQDAAMARLGLPDAARPVLTEKAAKDLTQAILRAEPETKANIVAGIEAQYGAAWPRILGDLQRIGKLPAIYAILGSVTDPVGRVQLAEAMQVGHEALRKTVGKDATVIDQGVHDALAPLRRSLALASNGGETSAQYEQAAALLAYRLAAQMPAADAVRRAVAVIADDRYDYADSAGFNARAPKGRLADAEAMANTVLGALQPEHLLPPAPIPGIPLTDEQRARGGWESARRGVWVTNERDDGWFLLDSARLPVLRRDGSRVEFKFRDMQPMPQPQGQSMGISP